MKKRKCWRYTCDYCKKSGCSASAMTGHESRCFGNPNRHCTMCESQWPRPELLAMIDGVADLTEDQLSSRVEELEKAAEFCPACVVSAWKQAAPITEVDGGWVPDRGFTTTSIIPVWLVYDYKAKSAEYMDEKRREETAQFSRSFDF